MFANFTNPNGSRGIELWIDNNRYAYVRITQDGEETHFFKLGHTIMGATEVVPWSSIPTDLLLFMQEILYIMQSLQKNRFDPYDGICEMPPEFAPIGQNRQIKMQEYFVPLNRKARRAMKSSRKRDAKGRYISTR